MTTALDRAFVQAQIHTIRSLLESAAPNDFGGRMSLQGELADFEDRLEAMGHIVAWTGANAQLAFTGKPVVGTTGIDAGFAATACDEFDQLVRMVRAEEAGLLTKDAGTIPDVAGCGRLLIVGTVHGSFGFELVEEPPEQQEVLESQAVAALDRVGDMLLRLRNWALPSLSATCRPARANGTALNMSCFRSSA